MHRRDFLKAAGSALAGITFLRHIPTPAATIAPTAVLPSGTFSYIDAGTLELGIVRDSLSTPSYDWQMFAEVFENVAVVETAP